jgi:hypothetical protein
MLEQNHRPAAPFRHESDTSREAAERLQTAQRNRTLALEFIKSKGMEGATIDEVCVYLTGLLGRDREIPPNAISGRFSQLCEEGLISKTPMRRKTRTGRAAVVYIAGRWADHAAPPAPPSQQSPADRILDYEAKLQARGHGHVVRRVDGKREGCGGVGVCKICKQERAYMDFLRGRL